MNKKKLMIIIAAAVVVLAGGGGAAYYFLAADSAQAAAEAPAKPSIGLIEMETFLTNINDPRSKHHARLQLRVAVSPAETAEKIKTDPLLMARMRDHVLTLLTSKTFDELSQSDGKEAFRKEIAERLAPLVESGKVQEVLFSDFVVQ